MSTQTISLLILVGGFGGFINVMAAGGSALTVPFLIFLGLDPHTANGTNRIPITLQSFAASLYFARHQKIQYKKAFLYGLVMIPGAMLGVYLSTLINKENMKGIISLVILGLGILIAFPKMLQFKKTENKSKQLPFLLLALALLGVYGGFIQIGMGFLYIAIMQVFSKKDLLEANIYKVFVIPIYMIPSIWVFLQSGHINWKYGFVMGLGNMVGAVTASKLSILKGDSFIQKMVLVAMGISILKLLFF